MSIGHLVPQRSSDQIDDLLAACTRGTYAIGEMLVRPGMKDKAEAFFDDVETGRMEIPPNYLDIDTSHIDHPTEQDYRVVARQAFDVYRKAVVEKACEEVSLHLDEWTFSSEKEWKRTRMMFKDFMWTYVKMVATTFPSEQIVKVMKENFAASLPRGFWPILYEVVLPPEKEFCYPDT
jgi:hypothetical protein